MITRIDITNPTLYNVRKILSKNIIEYILKIKYILNYRFHYIDLTSLKLARKT